METTENSAKSTVPIKCTQILFYKLDFSRVDGNDTDSLGFKLNQFLIENFHTAEVKLIVTIQLSIGLLCQVNGLQEEFHL